MPVSRLTEIVAGVLGYKVRQITLRTSSAAEGARMAEAVEEIEAWLGQPLPEPYRSFLAGTGESFLAANDRTLVYGRDTIVERNDTYESQAYCAGHLMVGDDSGGSALVLSLADGRIHSVDMGAMTPDCFVLVAPGFAAWADAAFPFANG